MENQRQCIIPIHNPSVKEFLFFFISGIVVSIPFTLFFSQFYEFVPVAIAIVLFAPFVEELAKAFPLFYRHGETERSIVTLGLLIGLGFGLSELVLYVFFLDVPFIARISGVIFHTTSSAIVAYGIAVKRPLPFYLIAVMLHATNNFFAIADVFFGGVVAVVVLLVTYFLARKYYRQSSKEKIVV